MSRACTPPHGKVRSLPPEATAEPERSSRSSVVLLSCSSDGAQEIYLTQLKGSPLSTPSPAPPPLTQERLLALQQCLSDGHHVTLTLTNGTVTLGERGQTGTVVAGDTHFNDHASLFDTQREERVQSWLAGTSASPDYPLDGRGEEVTDRVVEGCEMPESLCTPSRVVASGAFAHLASSTQTPLRSHGGSADVSCRSPREAEPSSPSAVVPLWRALSHRTPARYSFTEKDEGVDDGTPAVALTASRRRSQMLGRRGDYRHACSTPLNSPQHPWTPSQPRGCSVKEAFVAAPDRRTLSNARDSPRPTPPPLASLFLPFMTSPLRGRPSVAPESAKECSGSSVARSEAVREARNGKGRHAAAAAASIPRATSSHSDSENAITLRVCTLSGLTLRVTVDRCLGAVALAQHVAQYLNVRGAQVQLKYTRTGDVFDAASSSTEGPPSSSVMIGPRLCDLPGLQPFDMFVVLLRAEQGEPSPSPRPSRLPIGRRTAGCSPSPTPSSASPRAHLPRRHATAAKRPRQSALAPSGAARPIAESSPPQAGAQIADGVRGNASEFSREAQMPPVSGCHSSRARCAPLSTPSLESASPMIHLEEEKPRRLGGGMRSRMMRPVSDSPSTPATAPVVRLASPRQAVAPTASSAYASHGPAGDKRERTSAGSYCYPPLTRSHPRQG
ncbi:hypothetical protein LSCM1_07041 [Leishmania martiniquensis]|uniref:Uncharacterized protein n=1 Tax=Leishmania martiniquensis TaxID=1580590 RepID=A0A836H367_9TRYP|nr:hypothetical protein LSCM1_07041 [Leishmania martiniquensis]